MLAQRIDMKSQPVISIIKRDYDRISSLLESIDSEIGDLLDEEINRATVLADIDLPSDLIIMGSKVSYLDLDSNTESTLTLVYPHEAKADENKISILAPVGSALIGLRTGQIINWPLPNGKVKQIKVLSVLHQDC